MWEVFTEGKMPFDSKSNSEVVREISEGYRLYRPYLAPLPVYKVMYSCWHEVCLSYFLFCMLKYVFYSSKDSKAIH